MPMLATEFWRQVDDLTVEADACAKAGCFHNGDTLDRR